MAVWKVGHAKGERSLPSPGEARGGRRSARGEGRQFAGGPRAQLSSKRHFFRPGQTLAVGLCGWRSRSRSGSPLGVWGQGSGWSPAGRGRWFRPSGPTDVHPLIATQGLPRSSGSPCETGPTRRRRSWSVDSRPVPGRKGPSSTYVRRFFGERDAPLLQTSPHSFPTHLHWAQSEFYAPVAFSST